MKRPTIVDKTPLELRRQIGLLAIKLTNAEAERDRLRALLAQHNTGCDAACGKTTTHDYVRDSRRCDPRRDCPDCPRDWRIEL